MVAQDGFLVGQSDFGLRCFLLDSEGIVVVVECCDHDGLEFVMMVRAGWKFRLLLLFATCVDPSGVKRARRVLSLVTVRRLQ